MIKTLEKGEAEALIRMLPFYVEHMTSQPDSLVVKFLGLHAIVLYNVTKFFVVMESVFKTDKDVSIHERYDLKGSWVDRSTAGVARGITRAVLKDSDLHRQLRLDAETGARLIRQCELDARFLCSMGIMDYSLLLGIHHTEQLSYRTATKRAGGASTGSEALSRASTGSSGTDDTLAVAPELVAAASSSSAQGRAKPKYGQRFASMAVTAQPNQPPSRSVFQACRGGLAADVIEGPSMYFVGIIDVLQEWTLEKKAERCAKTTFLCKSGRGISAIEPQAYCDRFVDKVKEIVKMPDDKADASAEQDFATMVRVFGGQGELEDE